jgi:hypothetical protein
MLEVGNHDHTYYSGGIIQKSLQRGASQEKYHANETISECSC